MIVFHLKHNLFTIILLISHVFPFARKHSKYSDFHIQNLSLEQWNPENGSHRECEKDE